MSKLPSFSSGIYLATLYQLAVAFIFLWLSRYIFVAYNFDSLAISGTAEALRLGLAGLRFDLSALLYFNVLFIAMRIIPWPWQTARPWLKASGWVYAICNVLMLVINIADAPYYSFTGARLRWSNILNVTTDSGIGNLVGSYALMYIGIVGVCVAMVLIMLGIAFIVRITPARYPIRTRVALFLLLGFLCFAGMRGRIGSGLPLAIGDAAFGVREAPQINAVLNSPFCILRSLNTRKSNYEPRLCFFSPEELAAIRTSVHVPSDTTVLTTRNIVTIIIESGGAEWLDSLTLLHEPGSLKLMPFLDSIAGKSLVFRHVLATGRVSLGGETAVFGGFPAFDPFYYMLSPYNKNIVDSPARLLKERGWTTAFFYGVNPGSFNMDQTAFALGYDKIYNRKSYGNDSDFDGKWGIFDIPMAEFTVRTLSTLSQPFMAAWFTISAHGPFTLPKEFDTSSFRHKEPSPERGLEYTDLALRRFFTMAAATPWFSNTTFIITGDHGNRDFKGTDYDTDFVRNRIPFIIYTPDGTLSPRTISDRVLSQFDIAPTTLGLVGYDRPFVSLGHNALDENEPFFGIYRGDGGRYLIADTTMAIYTDASCTRVEQIFDLRYDPCLRNPLGSVDSPYADRLLMHAKAFIQDYTSRLNDDRMTIGHP